jgi:hypothetical protein
MRAIFIFFAGEILERLGDAVAVRFVGEMTEELIYITP